METPRPPQLHDIDVTPLNACADPVYYNGRGISFADIVVLIRHANLPDDFLRTAQLKAYTQEVDSCNAAAARDMRDELESRICAAGFVIFPEAMTESEFAMLPYKREIARLTARCYTPDQLYGELRGVFSSGLLSQWLRVYPHSLYYEYPRNKGDGQARLLEIQAEIQFLQSYGREDAPNDDDALPTSVITPFNVIGHSRFVLRYTPGEDIWRLASKLSTPDPSIVTTAALTCTYGELFQAHLTGAIAGALTNFDVEVRYDANQCKIHCTGLLRVADNLALLRDVLDYSSALQCRLLWRKSPPEGARMRVKDALRRQQRSPGHPLDEFFLMTVGDVLAASEYISGLCKLKDPSFLAPSTVRYCPCRDALVLVGPAKKMHSARRYCDDLAVQEEQISVVSTEYRLRGEYFDEWLEGQKGRDCDARALTWLGSRDYSSDTRHEESWDGNIMKYL